MIPRAGWVALIAGLLFSPAPAGAQVRLSMGLGGGPSFPLEELNRTAATGFHVAPHVVMSGTRIELRAEAIFESFASDGGGALDGIGGIASMILPLGAARTSYFVGGVGMLQIDPGVAPETRNELTYGVGVGTRLNRFFLELRYLDSGEHARSLPVTFGLLFR